jgi:DNA repair exonuclease SbcCD nuclease subunit
VLKLLHTADWHLGKRYPSFPEETGKRLMRARLDVVDGILDLAVRRGVDAVLCAGDLFDVPDPSPDWWRGLAEKLKRRASDRMPPVFLLPGNHDPLTADSVWSSGHPFRVGLPAWVHIVDRDDFEWPLGPEATLFARPCRSRAGQSDPALALPARPAGDRGIRVGCVHGTTFDIPGYEMNFPICQDAGQQRGLDYLAIGDTHAFRDVNAHLPWPAVATVYPGAPEPTAFDEHGAGNVAIVGLFPHGRRPTVQAQRVAAWTWREVVCESLGDLRAILAIPDLERHVLRVKLAFAVSVAEEAEVDRILAQLAGTEAAHGRAGVFVVDRSGLRLVATGAAAFSPDLPAVVLDAVNRLQAVADAHDDPAQRDTASRALSHLYKLLQRVDAPEVS